MRSLLLAITYLFVAYTSGYSQSCASSEYRSQLLRNNPSLSQQIQQAEAIANKKNSSEFLSGVTGSGAGSTVPVIRIPVVVHVVYRDASQNITDEQILSQIDVLNKAFRHQHEDTARVPAHFKSLAADTRVEFVMARVNPAGYASNGIIRIKTNAYSFGFDDKIKYSSSGGDDAWDTDRYLNIWVANLMIGVIGYSSPLGGPKERDGVVVRYDAFGNTGKLQAPYLKGRIAVHEVGHWMGLRHIWGDQYCGDDGVDDTPRQGITTRGCPAGIIESCDKTPGGIMYNNYMDLTDDNCMNMFSIGQREKMRGSFAEGAAHFRLSLSNAGTAIPLPEPPPIDPIQEKTVRVFPNPASSQVIVDISSKDELLGQTISIHNQWRQLVKSIVIGKTVTTVFVSDLKDGIYFLKLGTGSKTFKLMKTSTTVNNP